MPTTEAREALIWLWNEVRTNPRATARPWVRQPGSEHPQVRERRSELVVSEEGGPAAERAEEGRSNRNSRPGWVRHRWGLGNHRLAEPHLARNNPQE